MVLERSNGAQKSRGFDVCQPQPGFRRQSVDLGATQEIGVIYTDFDEIDRRIEDGYIIDPVSSSTGDGKSLIINLIKPLISSARVFMPRVESGSIPTSREDLHLTFPQMPDLPAFVAAEHDNIVRQHAIFQPAEEANLAEAIGLSYYNWRRGDATFLVLRSRSSSEPLAKVALRRVVPPGVLDVGYVTMPGHRGHHYSAIALKAFTKWVFEQSQICRIELGIKPRNIPSIRTAEHAGYHFESIRRARLSNGDGTFEDEHSYVAISSAREGTHV